MGIIWTYHGAAICGCPCVVALAVALGVEAAVEGGGGAAELASALIECQRRIQVGLYVCECRVFVRLCAPWGELASSSSWYRESVCVLCHVSLAAKYRRVLGWRAGVAWMHRCELINAQPFMQTALCTNSLMTQYDARTNISTLRDKCRRIADPDTSPDHSSSPVAQHHSDRAHHTGGSQTGNLTCAHLHITVCSHSIPSTGTPRSTGRPVVVAAVHGTQRAHFHGRSRADLPPLDAPAHTCRAHPLWHHRKHEGVSQPPTRRRCQATRVARHEHPPRCDNNLLLVDHTW